MSDHVELARQEGREFRSVLLSTLPDGVRLSTQDLGPTAEEVWGRDGEYEFWIDVTGPALRDLLFSLLKGKYEGQLNAVDQLREFCKEHGIVHDFNTWS